jgi:hypothetical protein
MADATESLVEGFAETLRSARDAAWEKHADRWPSLHPGEPRQFGVLMAQNIEALLNARENRSVDDAVDFVAGQFALELKSLLKEHPDAIREFLSLGALELSASTRASAADLVAPILWRSRVGGTIETGDVVRLLGVTRQAVHKQVQRGRILGLAGSRTNLFPIWQFDTESRSVRHGVFEVLEEFRGRLGEDFDPLLVAAWSKTRQYEDLDGRTPSEVFFEGPENVGVLVNAAARAASRLAQ